MASVLQIPPNRVAVDSSVFFAAARSSSGYARDLLAWGIAGAVNLAISAFVYEETREHLAERWPTGLPFFAQIVEAIGVSPPLPPEEFVRQALPILDDPEDAPIVAAAAVAEAHFLASYDRKHLLAKREEIRRAFGVEVATPDEILTVLGLTRTWCRPTALFAGDRPATNGNTGTDAHQPRDS